MSPSDVSALLSLAIAFMSMSLRIRASFYHVPSLHCIGRLHEQQQPGMAMYAPQLQQQGEAAAAALMQGGGRPLPAWPGTAAQPGAQLVARPDRHMITPCQMSLAICPLLQVGSTFVAYIQWSH